MLRSPAGCADPILPDMDIMRWDTHCHLGWFSDPLRVASEAASSGLGALAVTVTPADYARLAERLSATPNVRVAAGLHPWWVRAPSDVGPLLEVLPHQRWVGEVGLDASARHVATWSAQLAAFELISRTCAETSAAEAPKVLSVHVVRAAGEALDVLERTRAASRCRCVMHWFSGASDELWRAARLGCWFSFGERALATRRGREYARVVPEERLLAETDLPQGPGSPGGAGELEASLRRVETGIAAARGMDPEDARALLAKNAARLVS